MGQKVVIFGSFLDPFWVIFDPLLDPYFHVLRVIRGESSLNIWVPKYSAQKGCPEMTHFWVIFGPPSGTTSEPLFSCIGDNVGRG